VFIHRRPDSRPPGFVPTLHPLVSEGETPPFRRGKCGAAVTVIEKSGRPRRAGGPPGVAGRSLNILILNDFCGFLGTGAGRSTVGPRPAADDIALGVKPLALLCFRYGRQVTKVTDTTLFFNTF